MTTLTNARAEADRLQQEMEDALARNDRKAFDRAYNESKAARRELAEATAARDRRIDELLNGTTAIHGDIRRAGDAGMSYRDAPGAALDGIWPSFGAFLSDLRPRNVERKGVPQVYNNLVGTDDVGGGYLAPREHYTQLMRGAIEDSIVRSRATVIPMNSDSISVPRIDESTRADGTVFGGLVANWTAEAATIDDSDPTFGELPLDAKKLALRTIVSAELFQDSVPAVDRVLTRMFRDAIRHTEDGAFLFGNGVAKPLGAFHASNPSLIEVNRQTSSKIAWTDVVNMFARLSPASMKTAAWIASQSCIPQLFAMTIEVGTAGGSSVFITDGSASAPPRLLGLPLIFSEHAKALGETGDLCLGDFTNYLVGDRQSLSVKLSEHERFSSDQVVVKGTLRVDGRPWPSSALTPANGGSTVSPFVVLSATQAG